MGVVNALLISAWALGAMGVFMWSVYDGVNETRQGWAISAALILWANVAVVGAWLRGVAMPGGLLSWIGYATGAVILAVVTTWLRSRMASWSFELQGSAQFDSTRDQQVRASVAASTTAQPSSGPLDPRVAQDRGGGYFLMTFGGIFAGAGGAVVFFGFMPQRHGPPLLHFRPDHPAFLLAVAGLVVGGALFLVGRSVVRRTTSTR